MEGTQVKKVRVNIMVPPGLWSEVGSRSAYDRRSRSAWVQAAIEAEIRRLKGRGRKPGDAPPAA